MIERITDILNAATGLPVVQAYGVARLMPGPHVRSQTGEYTPIAVDDNAPWSYWRELSHTVASADTLAACKGERHTLMLRLVALLNDDCDVADAMRGAIQGIGGVSRSIGVALGALLVQVPRATLIMEGVGEGITAIPLHRRLVAADITVDIYADAGCLAWCESSDVLCALIGAATNDAVKECLGDDRLGEICGGGGPCPDTTVNGMVSNVPDIHVKQGGVDVGTLDPVTGIHTVPVCPPAGDGTAVLRDTGGTLISTTPVPADGSVDITAPDGIYTVKDSAGSTLFTGPVKSGGAAEHSVGDGIVQAVNSLGGVVGAPVPVPAEGNVNVLAPDANIQVKDEANNDIGPLQLAPSGVTTNITAPSAQAQLVDSGGAEIGSIYVILSKDTRTIPVADSVITLPNGSTKNVRATQPYTVPATAPLKFSFSPYDQGSDLWKVTADEAGTYNAYTQDGGSGTITYSKNGGAFTALSGTITLAVGDTIQVRRTTITAAGWSRWQRQVTP